MKNVEFIMKEVEGSSQVATSLVRILGFWLLNSGSWILTSEF